jgi:hypothetical protein
VPDREFSGGSGRHRAARIFRDAPARPQRESQAGLQIEERHGAKLEFLTDDAIRLEAKTPR